MDLDNESRANLEALAERITEALTQIIFAVELKQPAKLTVKKGDKYRRDSFVGGETFIPTAAYVGKRGKLIVVYTPGAGITPGKYDCIECEWNLSRQLFEGFDEWVQEFTARDARRLEEEQERKRVERKKEETRYEDMDIYGSW